MAPATHTSPRAVDPNPLPTSRVTIRQRIRELKDRLKHRAQGLYAGVAAAQGQRYAWGYHHGYGPGYHSSLQAASVGAGGGRKGAMVTAAAAATSSLAAVRVFKGNRVLADFKARFTAGRTGTAETGGTAGVGAGALATDVSRREEGNQSDSVILSGPSDSNGIGSSVDGGRAREGGEGLESRAVAGGPKRADGIGGRGGLRDSVVMVGEEGLEEQGVGVSVLQSVLLPLLGTVSHAFMHGLNTTKVINGHKLTDAISSRPPGTPLLSVSNHVAAMDDPLVMAAAVPPALMLTRPSALRWTLCASDRCFSNPLLGAFFAGLRALPVERGGGLNQPGMVTAARKLNEGGWVHIFPEGTRSYDAGRSIGPMRKGVGWLASQCAQPPLIIPLVHVGMHRVQARGQTLPAVGQRVAVLVGDPIDISDLLLAYGHLQDHPQQQQQQQQQHNQQNQQQSRLSSPPPALLAAISARIGGQLQRLKAELEVKEREFLEGCWPGEEIGVVGMEGPLAGVEGRVPAVLMGEGIDGAVAGRVADGCDGVRRSEGNVTLWNYSQQEQQHPAGTLESGVLEGVFPLPLGYSLEPHARRWHPFHLSAHKGYDSQTGSSGSRGDAAAVSEWVAAAAGKVGEATEAVERRRVAGRLSSLFGFAARSAMGGDGERGVVMHRWA